MCFDYQIFWSFQIELKFFTKIIYSKYLVVYFVSKQWLEPADVQLHAGLRASGNQVISFTT